MSKYLYSKLVMEKYLRRSFYDAVLELYEAAQGARIISVSLEGTLSLVVNKDHNFLIKLNEVAQRADDREDHLKYNKCMDTIKVEEMERYSVKKEELYHSPHSRPAQTTQGEEAEVINLEVNQKDWTTKGVVENGDGYSSMRTVENGDGYDSKMGVLTNGEEYNNKIRTVENGDERCSKLRAMENGGNYEGEMGAKGTASGMLQEYVRVERGDNDVTFEQPDGAESDFEEGTDPESLPSRSDSSDAHCQLTVDAAQSQHDIVADSLLSHYQVVSDASNPRHQIEASNSHHEMASEMSNSRHQIVAELSGSRHEMVNEESNPHYQIVTEASNSHHFTVTDALNSRHHITSDFAPLDKTKTESAENNNDDICFVTVERIEDQPKRKLDCKDSDLVEGSNKKSPRKRRKITISTDGEDDGARMEDLERAVGMVQTPGADDVANSGLQLLPHTATGPIIVEDEESYTGTQMAQLAMLQMRESNLNVFRPQDLEELARQQQWQMVASYQRSFMEKSYLQHQMQQYQRDTERLRWEYAAAHTVRDFPPQSGDEAAEKLYRQAAQQAAQSSGAEAALLAAAALEEAKKSSREVVGGDLNAQGADKMAASQYLRILSEEASANQVDAEYEEGELRPLVESHNCALCNTKFPSMDSLLRHMEKHRVAFERSCSVCQSGTLTGNMLILHMEASHGPESSFSLPSSAPPVTMSATVTSNLASSTAAIEYPQSFATATSNYPGATLDGNTSSAKLSQEQQQASPTKHTALKEESIGDTLQSLNYHLAAAAVSSHPPPPPPPPPPPVTVVASAVASSSSVGTSSSQDNFLNIPPQFYPLIGCQICGEKFALSEALDQHVDLHHKEIECSYTCKPCGLSFGKHVEFSKHMSRHEAATSAANLKCSHCLKSFKSVKQLRLHYVAAHSCCHFCEYCRAGFPDAVALQLHEQLHTLDPEKLSYRCDICNKAFYTQSQCSAHKRTHKDEKAHACDMCGSAFFKRGDLTKHVRTVHSPSRLFACKFCGKKGTRMDNMRSHVRSHHKNMSRDQVINMIEVIE